MGLFKKSKILVIGDIMLDKYLFGEVNRMSPEAPVPVFDIKEEINKPGGAANVALNLSSLGASVMLAGVLGNDDEGKQIEDLLMSNNIELIKVTSSTNRPSTQKLRIISHIDNLMKGQAGNAMQVINHMFGFIYTYTFTSIFIK